MASTNLRVTSLQVERISQLWSRKILRGGRWWFNQGIWVRQSEGRNREEEKHALE